MTSSTFLITTPLVDLIHNVFVYKPHLASSLLDDSKSSPHQRKFELEVHRIYTEHRWEGEEGQKNEEREEVKSIVFYRSPRASPLVRGLARVMVGQV